MFLLPSVLAALFFLFGAFFLFLKKKKTGRAFIILSFLFYYAFSVSPVSDFLLNPLEKEYSFLKEEEMDKANKVVLLLGGRESDILRGSEVLRISHTLNHRAGIIISGTDPLNPKSEEAFAVRNFFISRGVPSEKITIEGSSKNTWENVRNVKEIINDEPFFLVTSAYHMNRAVKEFQRVGLSPIPSPTDFKRKGEYNMFDIFPSPENLKKSDLATKEHLGEVYYKILFFFEKQE
ncbi:MAG: YdcF family protein [Candidatus Pacebacteria bacterium]|nr:YdcF family protein [Candidatus Paceibacterota bacterium]MDD3729287.1 YdcF family protein [Candidatus Paceibacterota bacterium]MDD5446080.1 YdcF family protein [Candidatus Paceibacterota bacterium]